jgi:hypothetical protein
MESLSSRLARLERENRRLKVGGILVLALLGAVFLTGLSVEDPIIGAEAFTLVDKQGNMRAVFAMINEEPTLAMFDTNGKMRAGLSVVGDLPRLILYGEKGDAVWAAP